MGRRRRGEDGEEEQFVVDELMAASAEERGRNVFRGQ
jgi:hypothetical protein